MQQGVRFDPDMPQTIRLEFAKSNTKVSKPKQPAAAAATSHPALMHPLTGRKYAPPLVHSLDTSHLLSSHPLHRLQSVPLPVVTRLFFFKRTFFFTLPYIYIPSTLPPMPSRPDHPAQPSLYTPTRGGIREISSGIVRQPIEVRRGFTRQTSTPSALQIPFYKAYRRLRYKRDTHTSGVGQRRAYAHYHRALYSA